MEKLNAEGYQGFDFAFKDSKQTSTRHPLTRINHQTSINISDTTIPQSSDHASISTSLVKNSNFNF